MRQRGGGGGADGGSPGTIRDVAARAGRASPAHSDPARAKFAGDCYSPSLKFAFCVLALVRVLSANFNVMSDCDEVFNYWEQTHAMLYGYGLQTWEYSPEYALRSYAYTGLHAVLGLISQPISKNKVHVFFHIRSLLGMLCALAEAQFFVAVKARFGGLVANLTLLFLCSSAGMFLASTALLPNTFAMVTLTLATASWLQPSRYGGFLCVLWVSCAVLVGTPFVILLAVPLALDVLAHNGFGRTVFWGLLCSVLWLGSSAVVDLYYYGRLTCPIFNTLMYNALGSGAGSQLYGVEPASYYLKNLLNNFNLGVPLCLLLVPAVTVALLSRAAVSAATSALHCSLPRMALYMSPLFVWVGFMCKLEHKEERFLFPVYPLLCLGSALSLVLVPAVLDALAPTPLKRGVRTLARLARTAVCAAMVLLSLSRVVSMYNNYAAPVRVWELAFDRIPIGSGITNVCVSKEWYRFPSSFFTQDHMRMRYVESDFTGQLPQYFSAPPPEGTQAVHAYFNGDNVGHPSAFTSIDECDYFVDFEPPNQAEERLSQSSDWKVVGSDRFLDSASSHPLYRALYVPLFGHQYVTFSPYLLLQRVRGGGKHDNATGKAGK